MHGYEHPKYCPRQHAHHQRLLYQVNTICFAETSTKKFIWYKSNLYHITLASAPFKTRPSSVLQTKPLCIQDNHHNASTLRTQPRSPHPALSTRFIRRSILGCYRRNSSGHLCPPWAVRNYVQESEPLIVLEGEISRMALLVRTSMFEV